MARTLEVNGKARQTEGEAKVVYRKAPFEKARKLRGIYFIDPEDKEFKETIKNARTKLETSVAPAMPCKKSKEGETRSKTTDFKSKLACILEANKNKRFAYGRTSTEMSYCRKRGRFTATLQFGSQIYSYASSYEKFRQQKQQWTRNGKNWRKFRRGTWQKSKVRKRWSMKQGRRALQFILHHWWTYVIWKMLNWRQNT